MPELPTVIIVGRPNVGKSTLYNRLCGRRTAIVHERPGTTRDRNETEVRWQGRSFTLIDTAGWAQDDSIFSAAVRRQLEAGMKKADLVLFLVDGKNGLHPYDRELAAILRRRAIPLILVVNKIDNAGEETRAAEFYALSFSRMLDISANHGRNINELLDTIISHLPPPSTEPEPPGELCIKVILVGKPNVGKSSLTNRLANEERSIVHDAPGTTRDALDIAITREGKNYLLIDTPGLHRRRTFSDDLQYLATLSAQHAMERADVAVMVMDLAQSIGDTEAKIAEMVIKNRKACVLVVNKWDLEEEREDVVKAVRSTMEQKLPFLHWARVLYVSAKTGQRVERILDEVQTVFKEYSRIVPKDDLVDTVRKAEGRVPYSRHGRALRIRAVEQTGTMPPFFTFTVNDPAIVHFSYRRHLENILRIKFGFAGTPIALRFRKEIKDVPLKKTTVSKSKGKAGTRGH